MTAALLVKSVMEKEARERMIDAHTAKEILPELTGHPSDVDDSSSNGSRSRTRTR